MKISLSWLLDHIDSNSTVELVDIPNLVRQFNAKTAEIESVAKLTLNLTNFTIGRINSFSGQTALIWSPSLRAEFSLPVREGLTVGRYYLLHKGQDVWHWATGSVLGASKDIPLPAFYFANDDAAVKWSADLEPLDYIFEVDNKSLTHRPDMWGHRGFAREVAILLGLELRPLDKLVASLPIQESCKKFVKDVKNPISTEINTANCIRFATVYVSKAKNFASQLKMALRLVRLDQKPIDFLVDLTNYVMLDLGQPMHVFDANQLQGGQLIVREARAGESLKLLGGEEIVLQSNDVVVCDQAGPVALAGIKGGESSGVNQNSTNLLLEAATFLPTPIRQASLRHKLRTEASMRFEKSLDPEQTAWALQRYIKLQRDFDPSCEITGPIISLGTPQAAVQLELSHSLVERRLGIKIEPKFIIDILTKLGFGVEQNGELYQISVPSWRATKDVRIPEDLIEEIGRIWGYDQIPLNLPAKLMKPSDLDKTLKLRHIKSFLAFAAGMNEVENYPFYDESFLRQIQWQPIKAVTMLNPVSDNWRRLVTSLVPHLCKNILQNGHDCAQARFFEWGRIWQLQDNDTADEIRSLAGIMFQKGNVDFYVAKKDLTSLFQSLKLTIDWQKPTVLTPVWYHPHQTAALWYNGTQVGWAGKLSTVWMNSIAEGDAFAFEINGDFLLTQVVAEPRYQPLPRFQSGYLDISLFVPLTVPVAQLQDLIQKADERIFKVELIDVFSKDDWFDKKSLTFRYHFVDSEKTLSGADIAVIQQKVEAVVQIFGASSR